MTILMLVLGVRSVTLSGAAEGLKFYLLPDFTKITPKVVVKNGSQVLEQGVDYDVSFSYDIPTRTGTAVIKLKGSYSGTITAKFDLPNYIVVEGAGSNWSKTETVPLRFRANGAISKFTGVTIDGREISADNYTTENGSTIVKLKSEYLKTLTEGRHIIGVAYADGKALAIFSVTDTTRSGADTGDHSNAPLWIALMCASALSLGAAAFLLKKRRA